MFSHNIAFMGDNLCMGALGWSYLGWCSTKVFEILHNNKLFDGHMSDFGVLNIQVTVFIFKWELTEHFLLLFYIVVECF